MESKLQLYVQQEMEKLQDIIEKAEQVIRKSPEGTLRTIRNHGSAQYYWRNSQNVHNGVYIRKSNQELLHQLAQKEYAIKLLEVATFMKNELEKGGAKYDWRQLEEVHHNMPVRKQQFVIPLILSDQEYAREWQMQMKNKAENSEGKLVEKYPLSEENGFYTEQGELVRSKSEKIIADKLYMMGIPYLYECPLQVDEFWEIYPDFTVLNIKTRQILYWEHFGLMDQAEYCGKALKKISVYEKNGMLSGQTLITTFETAEMPLNSKVLGDIVQAFLLAVEK